MTYKRGDVVWVEFPFTDVSATKLRPGLVVSNDLVNRTGDYLLMQITTRLRNDSLSLGIAAQDYTEAPLPKQAELRVHKIFILNKGLIRGKVTALSDGFMAEAIKKLTQLLSG